jgi:hypothetical protein
MASNKASVEPIKTSQWEMALENLKEMEPEATLQMMRNGTLKKELDRRVIRYFQLTQKLQESMDEEAARETAQMEVLTPINPSKDRQTALTQEEELQMDQWKNGLQSTM